MLSAFHLIDVLYPLFISCILLQNLHLFFDPWGASYWLLSSKCHHWLPTQNHAQTVIGVCERDPQEQNGLPLHIVSSRSSPPCSRILPSVIDPTLTLCNITSRVLSLATCHFLSVFVYATILASGLRFSFTVGFPSPPSALQFAHLGFRPPFHLDGGDTAAPVSTMASWISRRNSRVKCESTRIRMIRSQNFPLSGAIQAPVISVRSNVSFYRVFRHKSYAYNMFSIGPILPVSSSVLKR